MLRPSRSSTPSLRSRTSRSVRARTSLPTVESRHDDGRPKRVRAKVAAAGFTDEEVTDYTWDEPHSVTWTLAESSVQSKQVATYTLTPTDTGTHVKLDLEIGVKVPMPGFVLKRVLKSALDTGSKNFKAYVEGR